MHDIAQHPQKARVKRVAPLGKDGIDGRKAILQPPALDRSAKAHAAFNRRNGKLGEQLDQMRIVDVVVDDEPGINRLILALARDDRPCVATKTRFGLVQHDGVGVGQKMGRRHAGNPTSDNSNAAAGGTQGLERHSGNILRRVYCLTWRDPGQITVARRNPAVKQS